MAPLPPYNITNVSALNSKTKTQVLASLGNQLDLSASRWTRNHLFAYRLVKKGGFLATSKGSVDALVDHGAVKALLAVNTKDDINMSETAILRTGFSGPFRAALAQACRRDAAPPSSAAGRPKRKARPVLQPGSISEIGSIPESPSHSSNDDEDKNKDAAANIRSSMSPISPLPRTRSAARALAAEAATPVAASSSSTTTAAASSSSLPRLRPRARAASSSSCSSSFSAPRAASEASSNTGSLYSVGSHSGMDEDTVEERRAISEDIVVRLAAEFTRFVLQFCLEQQDIENTELRTRVERRLCVGKVGTASCTAINDGGIARFERVNGGWIETAGVFAAFEMKKVSDFEGEKPVLPDTVLAQCLGEAVLA